MNHSLDIRVYYEDTDAGAFVYYANYLKFAERGRTELLRSLGFENKSLLDGKGIAFVVRHIEADYFKPAFLDDLLTLETEIHDVRSASVIMKQSLFRQMPQTRREPIFSMDVTLACIDAKAQKPVRFSPEIRAGFERYLKNDL